MNTDTLQLLGQVILIGLGPVLAKHGITLGNADLDKVLGGLSLLVGIIWKFWHWNATPSAPAATVPINRIVSVLALTAALLGLGGCVTGCGIFAKIQPGNDPLVVNVERSETIAKGSFDLVLKTDNDQRDFYRTNAPAFHSFCEWLRQPMEVPDPTSTNGAVILPRSSAIVLQLDNVKLEYKSAQTSSNELYTALTTLSSVVSQANSWLTVVTNKPAIQ